ncbi:hypothetical protein ACWGKX_43840, partial [Streptomyces tricolor]
MPPPRAYGAPEAADDPYALHLAVDEAMVNGSGGRLELEAEGSRWQRPGTRVAAGRGAHGEAAASDSGAVRLTPRPLGQPPAGLPVRAAHEAHGGGDPRMPDTLFGPAGGLPVDGAPGSRPRPPNATGRSPRRRPRRPPGLRGRTAGGGTGGDAAREGPPGDAAGP